MESYISFSIISVFFYTFMILTLLAGKRSRIINSFMCVLGGMLCWTLGSFLMRMEAGPSYILWYYVSLAGILFLPYFYYVFISEFMGVRMGRKSKIPLFLMLLLFVINIPGGILLRWPDLIRKNGGAHFVYKITPWFLLFFVVAGITIIQIFITMYRGCRRHPGYRKQIEPILVGILIIFVGNLALAVPVFSGFPIDIVSGLINAVLMLYALTRRRLFQMRRLASDGVCFGVGVVLTVVLFINLSPYLMSYILYGLAPLPFATGLFPLALKEDIDIRFLPEVEDAVNMSFGERNKEGFKMAMKQDVEFFFGLGSVAYAVSQSLTGSVSSGKSKTSFSELLQYKPKMLKRILNAKKICKKEKRELLPKDLFHLKGFMVAGTDNQCYKDDLEEMWGVRPMELFAGTEPSIIGTETWTRNGMYFFPDTCFYEFITEKDMLHNYEDPTFTPPTYLMDEVVPGEKYELVITVLKGGAFARYRVGDMYRCVGLTNQEDRTQIPRFEYIDRVPWIIDIAGFTRISENGIKSVIQLSGQPVTDWIAVKEYNEKKRPYLHLYIEVKKEALMYQAMSTDILKELLTTYFKYIDQDYRDLKKILGMDPLVVTILRCGTFHLYESRKGRKPRHMSTPYYEVAELLRLQDEIGLGNMRK